MIKIRNIAKTRNCSDEYYICIPVIRWLIDNVGAMAGHMDHEWPHGDGWSMGYDYRGTETIALDWETWHCIVIHRQDIDPKLLTEFALRFV